MKLLRLTLQMQTVYYLATAIWPLVDINSFMLVSGPKTDTWLVRTVAVILLAISFCFIAQLFTNTSPWPVAILAIGCCIGFTWIDFYYALSGRISKVYLVDAGLQILLLILWVISLQRLPRHSDRFKGMARFRRR